MFPLIGSGIFVAVFLFVSSFRQVQQGEEALVATFGKYKRKLGAGPHFITPIIDSISYKGSIKEQVLDVPPQKCITRDNVAVTADAVVYWRVFDMEKAFYKIDDLRLAITNLVLTQLRSEIGNLELDQTFTARNEINTSLLLDLDKSTDPWGVKVTRVELRDILPTKEVQDSMELQMSAERKKRAAILTSEADRDSAINRARGQADAQLLAAEAAKKAAILQAEGQRQARILQAEAQQQEQILRSQGTVKAMQLIQHGLKQDPKAMPALQFLLAQNYIDMGATIGTSNSSKVMFMDPRSVPGTIEGMKSIISDSNVDTMPPTTQLPNANADWSQ
jgi:regulator of protease activity HflC (stomatin/prohibitin superfamily)